MRTTAQEGQTSAEAVAASMIPSACPDDELATHSRHDPYWDRLWAPGSQALWATGHMARQRKREGLGRVNVRHLLGEAESRRLLTANRGRANRLAGWAVIDSWRTASAEQLAAITGSRLFLDPNYSAMAASFALNLVDFGTYANPLNRTPSMDRNVLYRPANSEAFDKIIMPTLTWPEWISITGGYPWSSGGQYDRHNVLATELGLRAAEYLPVGTVLGEKFSTVDLLCGTGLGKKVKKPDNRRADGTIIRHDGLRIAFELTATASKNFRSKVRRWAELISERPLETSGLTVLFIAAPHPDRPKNTRSDPRHDIYRAISSVMKEFPGTGKDSPAARIGVASWDDWFPARHEMTEQFFGLAADFAIGGGIGQAKWVRRELIGDYPFTPWRTFDAMAVIDNSKLLAATPHWLRKGDHTHLIGSPMDRAREPVPIPSPTRPSRVKGRPLGGAVGCAPSARLPIRLRVRGESH